MISANNYSSCFLSELSTAKKILSEICEFISRAYPGIDSDSSFEFKLIFSELLCNAVIHGNKLNKNKTVKVAVEAAPDNVVTAVVRDEGPGFDYKKFLRNARGDTFSDIGGENGRGVWLVYRLADSLSFNQRGNEIKISKKVNHSAPVLRK
jgi:serine/threonine-protein kinase RsbW